MILLFKHVAQFDEICHQIMVINRNKIASRQVRNYRDSD
jgi:hypothetical protein